MKRLFELLGFLHFDNLKKMVIMCYLAFLSMYTGYVLVHLQQLAGDVSYQSNV